MRSLGVPPRPVKPHELLIFNNLLGEEPLVLLQFFILGNGLKPRISPFLCLIPQRASPGSMIYGVTHGARLPGLLEFTQGGGACHTRRFSSGAKRPGIPPGGVQPARPSCTSQACPSFARLSLTPRSRARLPLVSLALPRLSLARSPQI